VQRIARTQSVQLTDGRDDDAEDGTWKERQSDKLDKLQRSARSREKEVAEADGSDAEGDADVRTGSPRPQSTLTSIAAAFTTWLSTPRQRAHSRPSLQFHM